jgi:hypothetical protein
VIRAAVAAMYRRRGNMIAWYHAVPPPASAIDPLSGGPMASLEDGVVTGAGSGNFGENYQPPVNVFAYFSKKTSSFGQEGYGVTDIGDAQLDFAVPYVQAGGSALLSDAMSGFGWIMESIGPGLQTVEVSTIVGITQGVPFLMDNGQPEQELVTPIAITSPNEGPPTITAEFMMPHQDGARFITALGPTRPSLTDYNSGNFASVQNGVTVAFDRFVVNGVTYQAKGVPVGIYDQNVVVAWRVDVGKVGFGAFPSGLS